MIDNPEKMLKEDDYNERFLGALKYRPTGSMDDEPLIKSSEFTDSKCDSDRYSEIGMRERMWTLEYIGLYAQ